MGGQYYYVFFNTKFGIADRRCTAHRPSRPTKPAPTAGEATAIRGARVAWPRLKSIFRNDLRGTTPCKLKEWYGNNVLVMTDTRLKRIVEMVEEMTGVPIPSSAFRSATTRNLVDKLVKRKMRMVTVWPHIPIVEEFYRKNTRT